MPPFCKNCKRHWDKFEIENGKHDCSPLMSAFCEDEELHFDILNEEEF